MNSSNMSAKPKLVSICIIFTSLWLDEIKLTEPSVEPLSITTTSASLMECSRKVGRNFFNQFSPLKFNMTTAVLILKGL